MSSNLKNTADGIFFDSRWRTSDVIEVACGIYQDKAFDRMPILADALIDAGCDDEDILATCQGRNCWGPGHARNSWPIMLILTYGVWHQVYQALDMETNYLSTISNMNIVERCNIFTLPVIQGVTCHKIIAAFRKLEVEVSSQDRDLDRLINDRDLSRDGSYVVNFNVEADPENPKQTPHQRRQRGCQDIAVLEWLLLDFAHFLVTQHHLDPARLILCLGSSFADGSIPIVGAWVHSVYRIFVNDWRPETELMGVLCRPVIPFP